MRGFYPKQGPQQCIWAVSTATAARVPHHSLREPTLQSYGGTVYGTVRSGYIEMK